MRCARDKAPAPYELRMAWQAERWSALPDAGGLLDQQAGLISRMAAVANVYNAFEAIQSGKSIVQIANTQPQILKTVRAIERLEGELDG